MNIEICTDCIEGAFIAQKYGAKRIELRSGLSVGGLTPSARLIERCIIKTTIEVHVLIRPKEGGFNYQKEDIEIMRSDIIIAKRLGQLGLFLVFYLRIMKFQMKIRT